MASMIIILNINTQIDKYTDGGNNVNGSHYYERFKFKGYNRV